MIDNLKAVLLLLAVPVINFISSACPNEDNKSFCMCKRCVPKLQVHIYQR